MKLADMKTTLVAGWVLGVGLVGFTADATSITSWTFLVAVALMPPLVMLKLWNDPPETIAESIQQARR
jgi:hypothetical protein